MNNSEGEISKGLSESKYEEKKKTTTQLVGFSEESRAVNLLSKI